MQIGSNCVEYHVSTICSSNPDGDYSAECSAASVAYLVRVKAQVPWPGLKQMKLYSRMQLRRFKGPI